MSNILYKQYYREKGARYPDALTRVPEFRLQSFPRDAIFHVYDDGDGVPTVDTSKPYFKGTSRRIVVEHCHHLVNPQGPVREAPLNFTSAIQTWKQANLKTWLLEEDLAKFKLAPDQLGVVNYGFLDKSYKYQPVAAASYYRWLNRTGLIYETMNRMVAATDRHQFMILKIPKVMQGRAILEKFEDKDFALVQQTLFGEPTTDGFTLLDLWRWLSVKHRSRSLLNKIEAKHYSKIDFIFEGVTGKQILLNLGYLNSWIKGQVNTTEFSSVVQFAELNVQKLFLKLCLTLNEIPEVVAEDETATAVAQGTMTVPPTENEEEGLETGEAADQVVDTDQRDTAAVGKIMVDPNKADVVPKAVSSGRISSEFMDSIEADLEALDKISLTQAHNKGLNLSAKVNEETPVKPTEQPVDREKAQEEALRVILKPTTPAGVLMEKLAENAEGSLITAAEFRRMSENVTAFQESDDPYGSGKKRKEASVITPEELQITDNDKEIVVGDAVVDRTMTKSSLTQFNKKYLKTVFKKDILNAVSRLQAGGVVVKKHEVHRTTSILGSAEHHRLELKPIDGQPSTISFSVPVINEDGTFEVGGNKYLARKQRVDVPIRKIGPSVVSLSSYYGKTFVQISPKVANNSTSWIIRQVNRAIVEENGFINGISLGSVFDNEFKAPFIYNALASEFESFSAGKTQLFFDHRKREQKLEPGMLPKLEKNSRVFCGISGNKKPVIVDRSGHFFEVDGDKESHLGDIYKLLQLNQDDAPVDYSELRVFSKYVPVGIVLGYYVGFKTLLTALNAEYRIVEPRKNKMLTPDEYAISFKDVTYVFKRSQGYQKLFLAGFGEFEKSIKQFESSLFDHKDVYLNILMSKGFGALYTRELDAMENMFVDHITEEILADMKEPTTFRGLLYRSNELLMTYHHPVSQDRSVMRDRGYERFAGAVYKELVQATRQFRNKNLIGRSKIDMSPYQVWNAIMKDSSIKIVEDINPIQNMKESELITFAGTGGRNKETMTKPTRAFHVSSVGVDSESTVDNAGVGTVAYLSANPNISNLRGTIAEKKELNPTSMMSTAALVSPCSFNDNPKRIMFINTQHSHTIATGAYCQPYVRTGYEKVAAHRTTKLFSTTAEENGVVVSANEEGLIVKYESGRIDQIALGRQYGKAEGSVYPHDVISKLKQGNKFAKGAVLAFNEKFFEPDFLDPSAVNMKVSGFGTVAFIEDKSTHEDSCTISPKLGQRFETEVTKIKSYVVRFEQAVQEVIKIGEEVHARDVLMVIEDEITASNGQFSGDSLDTLKRLANVAPRAGTHGFVEKIEVYYHGEKRDMSPSLKKLADRSDAVIASQCKAVGQEVLSGRVGVEYRVSGTPLELDQAEIKIYITSKAPTGVGDKAIFGHQMKSTIAEVHPGEIFTDEGVEVDAIFSYRSLAGREVNSANLVGTTTVLLDLAAKRALNAYYGETK